MPDWAREVRLRLASLKLSPTRENEIVEELSQHLDDHWRELMAGGASTDEAARLALAEFTEGDVLPKLIASLRQAHAPSPVALGAPAGHLFADLLQDLRYGVRAFWNQPAFAAVAVLTIALGIGATTAMFSVVYGVLLKPLPFQDSGRLVAVSHFAPGFGPRDGPPRGDGPQSPATYFTYRETVRVFEDIGLWTTGEVAIMNAGEPQQVQALRVTDGFLSILKVPAALGRTLDAADDAPGAPDRVLLTHGYWQRVSGGARDIIGQRLAINGAPYEVIGVLPDSFRFLNTDPDVLLPVRLNRANALTGPGFIYQGVARLKPGVTLAQANDDVARAIPFIPERFPLQPGVTQQMWDEVGLSPNVQPLSETVIGDVRRPLWILMGSVAILLLMACVNVANLLLVRAEGRQRELSVRAALGASRGRIARALFAESLLLGLAGGALGSLFARGGIGLLRRMAPPNLPRVDEIGIDGMVLLFTLAISVVTALLFGLLPISRVGRLQGAPPREASDVRGGYRTRNTLVVAQIALALVLLIVSGLMVQTVRRMQQVPPGFLRPEEVQTFTIQVPAALVRDREQVARTHEAIADRLMQVRGVIGVGLSSSIAMDGAAGMNPVFVEDRPVPGTPPARRSRLIGPGYFEAMGNPVVAGRALTWTDVHHLRRVAMVSENLAREYWEEPSKALGRRIGGMPGQWFEIVGVVGDERADGLSQQAPPLVYWPMATTQFVARNMAYTVRSSRLGATGFLRELKRAVWSVNPNLPLANIRTLDEIQAGSMAQTSFTMIMLTIAAGVSLLLGVVGIYGVTRHVAAQRTREVGVRMALGAQVGHVRWLFLRQGLVLTLVGICLGIGAAMLLTRVVSSLLFGVGSMDPVTYVVASAGLAAVTALATYLPARRASAIDPLLALRSDV
jgi:putative ABC transport system permease protein